jgi:hypothetical protein
MQVQIPRNYGFATIFRVLFRIPGVVLIEGEGKIGKTDLALWITEQMLKISIRQNETIIPSKSDIASNIDTKSYYPQISDSISLKQWMYNNNHRKAFIMDEANEYLTNLRVMSTLNVGFTRLLPQVTKAHCRMIIVGHDFQGIDKNILRHAWCKGMFRKTSLKSAEVISNLLPKTYSFRNIPRTNVPFDPYAIAPFTEKPEGKIFFKDTDRQLLWDWSTGRTIKELNIKAMTLNRLVRKYVRGTLENDFHVSHA